MIQILHFIVKQKYEDVTVTLNKYWRSDSPLADELLTILGDERGLQVCMSVETSGIDLLAGRGVIPFPFDMHGLYSINEYSSNLT